MVRQAIRPIPRFRWHIAGLIAAGVLINYFDRISISVAGPQLERSFHLTPVDLGVLFSAFFWSYALLQIPAGVILDRVGVTRVGRWSAFLWSVASALTACAGGFTGLFLARLLLGIAEAPSFPASSKATGYWFPRAERALSTALFDVGAKFSSVIGVPLVAVVVVRLGWRWGFGVVAALSLAYFAAFYWMYRDPSQHPLLTRAEREYLATHGAESEGQSSGTTTGVLAYLLSTRKVWGLVIGFGAYGYNGHHSPDRRTGLDISRLDRPLGSRGGRLVTAITGCPEGRRRGGGRHHEFLKQHDGCRGAYRHRLRRRPYAFLRRRLPGCRPRVGGGRRLLRVKIPLYARHGVPEVWIIDLQKKCFRFYRFPLDGQYQQVSVTSEPGIAAIPGVAGAKIELAKLLQS